MLKMSINLISIIYVEIQAHLQRYQTSPPPAFPRTETEVIAQTMKWSLKIARLKS